MEKQERNKRLSQAIKETRSLLVKANKRLNNTKQVLKNERAGRYGENTKADIRAWVGHVKDDRARVKELEKHITKLQTMKK